MPAGAPKVGKVAKTIDNVSDVKSTGKGLKNATAIKEGKEFETQVAKEMREQGEDISTQVTLIPQNGLGNVKGNRTRVDIIVNEKNGTKTLIETKLSQSTKLSAGQKAAKAHIEKGNKRFEVRSKKDGYNKNYEIQIDNWKRKNKYDD